MPDRRTSYKYREPAGVSRLFLHMSLLFANYQSFFQDSSPEMSYHMPCTACRREESRAVRTLWKSYGTEKREVFFRGSLWGVPFTFYLHRV